MVRRNAVGKMSKIGCWKEILVDGTRRKLDRSTRDAGKSSTELSFYRMYYYCSNPFHLYANLYLFRRRKKNRLAFFANNSPPPPSPSGSEIILVPNMWIEIFTAVMGTVYIGDWHFERRRLLGQRKQTYTYVHTITSFAPSLLYAFFVHIYTIAPARFEFSSTATVLLSRNVNR